MLGVIGLVGDQPANSARYSLTSARCEPKIEVDGRFTRS